MSAAGLALHAFAAGLGLVALFNVAALTFNAKAPAGALAKSTLIILALAALSLVAGNALADVPRAALKYRHALTANARLVWGLDAPIATFAGQIHQESAWRADARSPYANGLAQFTPDTAEWIGGRYADLGARQPFNPSWALRALVRYDRYLWERNPAATDCDRMAFALASYNGGEGWLRKEQVRAAAGGADARRWFGHVERHCIRASWACRENRDYPRRILHEHQKRYATWGAMTPC